jgi:hypothetical protein
MKPTEQPKTIDFFNSRHDYDEAITNRTQSVISEYQEKLQNATTSLKDKRTLGN